MTGWVQCTSEEDFDRLIRELEEAGWLNEAGQFVDELNTPLVRCETDRHVNRELLLLEIPFACHRNLCRVEFFPPGARRRGMIAGTCTDGCCEAWLATPVGTSSTDLKEYMEEPCDPPECNPGDKGEEQAWEDYHSVLSEAECEFFNQVPMLNPPTRRP